MTLNNLDINQLAKVTSVDCDDALKQRLFDLGLVVGTEIAPIFVSPLGNPTAYEFRGNIIAIRSGEAEKIVVE